MKYPRLVQFLVAFLVCGCGSVSTQLSRQPVSSEGGCESVPQVDRDGFPIGSGISIQTDNSQTIFIRFTKDSDAFFVSDSPKSESTFDVMLTSEGLARLGQLTDTFEAVSVQRGSFSEFDTFNEIVSRCKVGAKFEAGNSWTIERAFKIEGVWHPARVTFPIDSDKFERLRSRMDKAGLFGNSSGSG